MCGSEVMRGFILETTRWRQCYQETKKTAFLLSTIVKLMMKHLIPPFFKVKDFKNASYFNLSTPEKKL